jgi:arylsulfatase A-like enzyme
MVVERARRVLLAAAAAGLGLSSAVTADDSRQAPGPRRPNVLFIAVDDMNVNLGCYGHGQVHSPNIDRLAERGITFLNAHCPSPRCGPSRAAILTGLRPWTTGIYDNNQWWRPHLPDVITLPHHFKQNGYYVAGAGKIHHHTPGNNPPDQWDAYFDQVFDNNWELSLDDELRPPPPGFPFNSMDVDRQQFDWGALPIEEEEYGDVLATDWIIQQLEEQHDQPFFLALGIYRPHVPWYAPARYFEQYPLDDLPMPVLKSDELEGVPGAGRQLIDPNGWFEAVQRENKWREAVQGYYASTTFADAQVGRVLDALDRSGHADNTIIVFWSDHGFHLGEKNHLFKVTLWERSTRVPFIMVVPGMTAAGSQSSRPVNLIDIFPTLNELCQVPEKPELEGLSLVPHLRDPNAEWARPSIISLTQGNYAVVSDQWHYIRYADDSEELYSIPDDPRQWDNLAGRQEYEQVKEQLRQWIPAAEATPAPVRRAYHFDRHTYTWTPRGERTRNRQENDR